MKKRPYPIISLLLSFFCVLNSCVIQMEQEVGVTGVRINKESAELVEGGTLLLVAVITPDNATNKTVSWTSSVPEVATVDRSGLVTAVRAGTAVIVAQAGLFEASCNVTVTPQKIPVTKVNLDKSSITLFEGEEETVTASIVPENATVQTVEWTSSDASVATVSGGKVTAIAKGTATVTASADGVYATCQVTVEERPSAQAAGIFLSGQEPYRFNPREHQISIYSAEGYSWYRFLLVSSLMMYQVGPIPDNVAEGDAVDVVLETYSSGVESARPFNCTMEVVSRADGVMTLVSAAGDMFILRY